ncbi:hypothetical protein [Massilimicrobiota timonensis]|uniref:hypothetical protein n=1 Tax=Massilimicrobiota timonensis TaxID=1776392 RepID=UPI001961B00D|nr:hypothetical protein [Massilimicrobiota timonensis]MBM6966107.1 hypothetical protein [Massilimicrobiota timonensis]
MYETGLIVKLKNANFISSDEISIKILDRLNQKNNNLCSIVFGRNGSGKSTISKSIDRVTKEDNDLSDYFTRYAPPIHSLSTTL